MIYEKATAEVILFDNSDVIRTSGESGCVNGNHPDKGYCPGNSTYPNAAENGINAWRAARSGR